MFSFAGARSPKSAPKAVFSALAAVTAAALLLLGVTAPASAVTTGSFNLTLHTYVNDPNESDPNAPVENAEVDIWHYSNDDGQWEQLPTTYETNSNGQLDSNVTGLVVGDQYAVYVNTINAVDGNTSAPITDSSAWLAQSGELTLSDFDDNPADGSDADTFFTATASLRNPIVVLNYGLSLSGNAVDSNNGSVDASAFDVYRQDTDPNGNTEWAYYNTANLGPNGASYSINDLPPGSYVVRGTQSSDPAVSQVTFNNGQSSLETATPVSVQFGQNPAATQDVEFVGAGTISGHVGFPFAFDPSVGVVAQAWAYPLDAQGNTNQNQDDAVEADVDPTTGDYSMSVAPGNYKVEFTPTGAADNSGYYPIWYNNAPFAQQAAKLVIPEQGDSQTGVDGTINFGTQVYGFVGSQSSGRLQGIEVDAISQTGNNDISTTTDNTGYYSLTLPPDYYNLSFTDPTGTYPARYFNGQDDGTSNIALATTISQTSGSIEDDFTWDSYGSLTVHVANKAGTSLAGVDIEAEPFQNGSIVPNADVIDSVPVTGHAGTYQLPGLQAGQQYALLFSPPASSGTYLQYWGGSSNPETSDLYTGSGNDDSLDVTLASSAAVSGVVTTTANKPIKGVYVDLYGFDGSNWNLVNYTSTGLTGAYSFPNLATGSYTVDFDTAGTSPYIGAWAGNGADALHATHVYVSNGHPASLSQHLALGGTITGIVGGPGGTPKVPGVEVDPISITGTPGHFTGAAPDDNAFAVTGSGGKFSLSGLPTGYYALSFYDFSQGEYGNPYVSPLDDPSTPVYHVTAGKVTATSGTIQLPLLTDQQTGEVDGSLDTTAVGPLGEAAGFVDFYDATTGAFVNEAAINTDGTFTMNLVPGDYTYSATIFDPDNPQNRFDQMQGDITVPDGTTPLSILVVPAVPLQFTTDPSIVDTSNSETGTQYTVNEGTWNHTYATASVQWLRNGVPIYGATGPTYTSQGADYGSELQARVTLNDDYFNVNPAGDIPETISYSPIAANPVSLSDQLTNTAPPTTTLDGAGMITVGQTAKAQPGDWHDIPGVTYTYQWIVDGGPDDGTVLGTGPTFTPTAAMGDTGDSVRLWVTARSLGYTTPAPASDTSSLLIRPLTAPTLKVAPKVTATPVTGGIKYTVTPGTWSLTGTTPIYSWNQEGAGQVSTTNTFTYMTGADPIPYITVTVGASKSGYASGQTTLVAQKSDDNVDVLGSTALHNSVVGSVSSYSTLVPVGSVMSVPAIDYEFADDSSAGTTVTYQWVRVNASFEGTDIKGATKSTYTVSTADIGFKLLLEVEVSNPTHLPSGFPFLSGTGELRQDLVQHPATVSPLITNTNAPGTKIVEAVSSWAPTTLVTNSYQWLICTDGTCSDPTTSDYTAIPNATLPYYVPTLAQANDSVVLRVTGSKSTYAPAKVYGPVTLVGNGTTISDVFPVQISAGLSVGNSTFGVKMTAKPAVFDVPGVTVSYDWQISTDGGSTWSDATGANGLSTYTPVFGDFTAGADHIRVQETATKAGYTSATTSSPAAPLVGAVPVPITKPTVSTTINAGEYTVNPGTWPSSGGVGSATYDWKADGSDLGTTTDNTYSMASFEPGSYVTVTVIWSGGAAYKPATYTIVLQKGSAPSWLSPTIQGITQYGNALNVAPTNVTAYQYPGLLPFTLSYQWYSNGAAIAKATAATLTPSTAYVGKTLSVKITATSAYYATASHVTAGVLFTAGPAQHGAPTLSYTGGTVHSGGTIGVTLIGYSVSGLSHSYQWQLSTDNSTWVSISGATKSTFVVPPADLGDYLRVSVGTSKAGYASASDLSDVQQIVEPTVLAPITAPTMTGAGVVGATLTAVPGTWNVTGTTFTYQWYRDGIIIPGATAATFTPLSDEFQEVVSVQITAHAAGYIPVVFTPNTAEISIGGAPTNLVKPKITGTATEGSTLTVTPGTWSLDGLTISYQWYYVSGGVDFAIGDASTNTLVLSAMESGSPVYCVVSVDRDGYQDSSVQTALTAVVP